MKRSRLEVLEPDKEKFVYITHIEVGAKRRHLKCSIINLCDFNENIYILYRIMHVSMLLCDILSDFLLNK